MAFKSTDLVIDMNNTALYSKLIMDFVKPILLDTDSEEILKKKITTAQTFWNYDIAKKYDMPAFKELQEQVSKKATEEEYKPIFDFFAKRKITGFSSYNNFITDIQTRTDRNGIESVTALTFNPVKYINLGTKVRPAIVNVQTEEEALNILMIADQHGWLVITEVREDLPENILEFQILKEGLHPGISYQIPPSRNEPCPCGSGKSYKRCCGS